MTDSQDRIEEQEVNLLELLQVLAKHKMLIMKICSVAMVVSVAISLMLPNIYSATAKVVPPQKDSGGGLSAILGQVGGLAGLASAAGGMTGGSDLYIGILKSRSVGDAVIKRLDLVNVYKKKTIDDTRRSLDDAVKVQAGKDGIIAITVKDKDARRAALLANTLVDELGKTTIRLNLSKAGTERLFLEKRLELVKKDLHDAEEEIKNFAQQNKIVQVDSQARASIEGIARIKTELANREVQLSVLRSMRTEESAEVKSLESGIKTLKGKIAQLSGNSGGGEGIPSVGNMPGVGLEYARRLRELKKQEAIFEQLTKQFEMAKLSEAKDSSSFQVLDEAVVPLKKSEPSRAVIVIVSTVFAFFSSLFIVFTLEYFNKMSDDDRVTLHSIKRQFSFR